MGFPAPGSKISTWAPQPELQDGTVALQHLLCSALHIRVLQHDVTVGAYVHTATSDIARICKTEFVQSEQLVCTCSGSDPMH